MTILLEFALFVCALLVVTAYAFQWRWAPQISILCQIPWLIHGLEHVSYGIFAPAFFFVVYHLFIWIYVWPPRSREETSDGEDQAHQEG